MKTSLAPRNTHETRTNPSSLGTPQWEARRKAKEFFKGLPPSTEDDGRFKEFLDFITQARAGEQLEIACSLYEMIAEDNGEIELCSLYDGNMILYSLPHNPILLHAVTPVVERWLSKQKVEAFSAAWVSIAMKATSIITTKLAA